MSEEQEQKPTTKIKPFPLPLLFPHPNFNEHAIVGMTSQNQFVLSDVSNGQVLFRYELSIVAVKLHGNLEDPNYTATFTCGTLFQYKEHHFLALGTNNKSVLLFHCSSEHCNPNRKDSLLNDWKLILTCSLKKKLNVVALAIQDEHKLEFLFGDKFGDVYSVEDVEQYVKKYQEEGVTFDFKNPEVEFGHISPLTDFIISKDYKFVFTSDRDGKIRTSKYPQLYDIHSFCLGHKGLVTRLSQVLIDQKPLLISGGIDGSLKFWDFLNEDTSTNLIFQYDLPHKTVQSLYSHALSRHEVLIAVTFERQKEVLFMKLVMKSSKIDLDIQNIALCSFPSEILSMTLIAPPTNKAIVLTLNSVHILQYIDGNMVEQKDIPWIGKITKEIEGGLQKAKGFYEYFSILKKDEDDVGEDDTNTSSSKLKRKQKANESKEQKKQKMQ